VVRETIAHAAYSGAVAYWALLACAVARSGNGLMAIGLVAYLVLLMRFDVD
jgi:hypothetical protein